MFRRSSGGGRRQDLTRQRDAPRAYAFQRDTVYPLFATAEVARTIGGGQFSTDLWYSCITASVIFPLCEKKVDALRRARLHFAPNLQPASRREYHCRLGARSSSWVAGQRDHSCGKPAGSVAAHLNRNRGCARRRRSFFAAQAVFWHGGFVEVTKN